MMCYAHLIHATLLVCCLWASTSPLVAAVGGGLLASGLEGTWYHDADFISEAFRRRDIRIDFDWGHRRPGGGLAGTQVGDLGANHYSVRWNGRLMPRFSEAYSISIEADSARLWIKAAADSWPEQPQIDHWPDTDSSTYSEQQVTLGLVAGQAYDIRIDYRERTGPARMRLLWSSPSTPQEVIEATAFVAEQPPGRAILGADAIWGATNWGDRDGMDDGPLQYGPDGWPAEDFTFLVRPDDPDINAGTYLMHFHGQARVTIHLINGETFASADGTIDFGAQLDPGEGYDAASNTTTARVTIPLGESGLWPIFEDTDRDGPGTAYATGSGITSLRLMRPTALGSLKPHGLDELFARESIRAMERFVTYRWNDVNNDGDVQWQDRQDLHGKRDSRNENLEYKILWCNRVGRDLWIQVPHRADDDYITQMAQLLRYGSDADGIPYPSTQAAPVHPPLNPNLRIYVEYTNECPWNTAGQYPQSNWVRQQAEAEIASDTAMGRILNYDGRNPKGLLAGKRYFAVRSAQISDLFRAVWGDAAMPAPGKSDPRVRPVLMWQYDNSNGTAQDTLFFLDAYFNRSDPASTYTGTPRTVNHYFYGAGAATYYASDDRLGIVPDLAFNRSNLGGFQEVTVAPGRAVGRAAGAAWKFSGTGGICHQPARQTATPGALGASTSVVDDFTQRGCRFTVGAENVAIYALGRQVLAGNDGWHWMTLYDATTHQRLFGAEVNCGAQPAGSTAWTLTGQRNFMASQKFFSRPIILQAGRSYYLVSEEFNGGDAHHTAAELTPPPGISIDGTVRGRLLDGAWTWEEGTTANRAYGPVLLQVATQPVTTADGVLDLGFVQDSKQDRDQFMRGNDPADTSTQVAFLAGTASAETTLTLARPGSYGLIYHLAYKRDPDPFVDSDGDGASDDEHLRNRPWVEVVIDGTVHDISPGYGTDIRPGGWHYEGYWTKPLDGFDFFGSTPFTITEPNTVVTLRFRTEEASTAHAVFIDNVVVASVEQMLAGPVPSGGGFAEGAPDVSNWEARVMRQYTYGQCFGLQAMAYEGGWYPGGDANKMPLQYMASFFGEAMVAGERNAVETLARAGLVVAADYSRDFALPDYGMGRSAEYSRIRAWDAVHNELRPEPTNGLPVASAFTWQNSAWSHDGDRDGVLDAGDWVTWLIIAPETGTAVFQVDCSGDGAWNLQIDEDLTVLHASGGGIHEQAEGIRLIQGLHALRFRVTSGSMDLAGISGARPGQGYGPVGLIGGPGQEQIYLTLPQVTDIDGFHVYYRLRTETAWTRHNTSLVPADRAGTIYGIDGLRNDTTYQAAVTVVRNGIESAFSDLIIVAPQADAPIISWEFDDSGPKISVAAGSYDPFFVCPQLEFSSGFGSVNNSYAQADAFAVIDGEAFARDETVYFTTTLAAAGAGGFSLESLRFGTFTGWTHAEDHWAVAWSQDGFQTAHTAPILSPTMPITGTSLTADSGVEVVADLSGFAALQDCTQTTEFRLYYWAGTSDKPPYMGLGKLGEATIDVAFHGAIVSPQRMVELRAVDSAGLLPLLIQVDQADATIADSAPIIRVTGIDLARNLQITIAPNDNDG